jgi:hypothetical protein
MLNPAAVQVDANPHLFLVGHPPVTEFIGFVTTQTLEGRDGDHAVQSALMDAWRNGNDHLLALEEQEGGYADGVELSELPEKLKQLAAEALTDPGLQRNYALTPISIEWIELDRLVIFQKQINLAFVDQLVAQLVEDPDAKRIFDFALPYKQRNDPPVAFGQQADGTWIFKSISNDFRILNAELLEPGQIAGLDAGGVPVKVVALSVGYGSNYLTALSVEGRLVLTNGSHRAYALRAAGQTHAPCLVQHVSRRDELRVLVGDNHALVTQSETFLETTRPPLFKDYFDEQLRMIVNVPSSIRQVQVGFNLGQADLPA